MTLTTTIPKAERYVLLGLLCIALLYIIGTAPAALATLPDPIAPVLTNPLAVALEGDFNLNGRLDFADVVGLFQHLETYRADCDLNHNGRTDFGDVVLLWGRL